MKPHTKIELQTSRFEKGESVHGPGHDGAPKSGFHAAKPVLTSHPHSVPNHAGMTDNQNVKAALGKTPPIKRAFSQQVPIHSAAERQTAQGVALGGDHSSALDAMSGAMVPTKDGSRMAPMGQGFANNGGSIKRTAVDAVAPVVGHRSRRHDRLGGGDVGENIARAPAHSEAVELGRRIYQEALDHERRPFDPRTRGKLGLPAEVSQQQTIGRKRS